MKPVPGDPLAGAMAIIGGRWTLALIFALFEAPHSFNALKAALSGISATVLARRLRQLADAGVIEQIFVSGRAAYALTDRGRDLAEVRDSILAWIASYPGEAR